MSHGNYRTKHKARSMAPSSSSTKASPSLPPQTYRSPHFTPIRESEREGNGDDGDGDGEETTPKHHPTPIYRSSRATRKPPSGGKPPESPAGAGEDDRTVSCNKCRPSAREKISVVPLDHNNSGKSSLMASPNLIFRSIVSSLTKKSPKPTSDSSASSPPPPPQPQWKLAVAELSNKLIQATRKRDEAVLEASRLKYSMAELEEKLNRLEVYCHSLKSGLEVCNNSGNSPFNRQNPPPNRSTRISTAAASGGREKVIELFPIAVSEARPAVRLLSRSLTLQIRQIGGGGRVQERISQLLLKPSQSPNPNPNPSPNSRSFLLHLEAVLTSVFFEDFETIGFQKNSPNRVLNPVDRFEANLRSFNGLRGLTWEEVLSRGTRHFSEDFSRFCDRKMSEVVSALGWNRAWPESLLQSFFGAAKGVWLVHLLATAVHPALPIFRVETGAGFDPLYMEDVGADKARNLVPTTVRAMVAPGFYVEGTVVKCKVLCRYYSCNSLNSFVNGGDEKGFTFAPSP